MVVRADFPVAHEEPRPLAATVLSLVAGLLTIADGLVLSALGGAASSLGLFSAGQMLDVLGFFGSLVGFIVLILAIQLYRNPDSHLGYGIAVIVLSLLGLAGGGGFFLGAILGVIGGILAVVFDPEATSLKAELGLRFNWQSQSICANCGALFDSRSRACPRCETPRPSA